MTKRFVDVSDPTQPVGLGTLALQGEPTSVDILGNHYALVAVNTSPSFVVTSGDLVVVLVTLILDRDCCELLASIIVIERDNRTGDWAEYKTLASVAQSDLLDGRVAAAEKSVFDLLPALNSTNGWITDKPEGVAVDASGELYLVTDNDGVEDWSGETLFLRLGKYFQLFQ